MKTFIEQAAVYGYYHEKKNTLYAHFIGVPLVVFGLMIFLGFFKLIVPGIFSTSLATLATLILFIYYLRLNWKLALLLFPILILLLWISSMISVTGPTRFGIWTFIIVSVIGWGALLVSHFLEGKRPAFMDSSLQLLVAPLVLTAEICFMAGHMAVLKEQIYGNPQELEISKS